MAGRQLLHPSAILRGLATAALLFGGPGQAFAENTIQWVEVALVLDEAGRADVRYQVRWRATAPMHGFHFQGETARPRFENGTAELPDGRQVPLSITPVESDRWDIVLAGSEAWGPGEATYTFSYQADLAAAGLVALTQRAEGEKLTVFNWSPVEWDQPLQHHTLTVQLSSVPAPHAGDLTLEEASTTGLRTEPWVNERYLISYRGVSDPPALWLRFHHENVPAQGRHRVQLYLPAAFS